MGHPHCTYYSPPLTASTLTFLSADGDTDLHVSCLLGLTTRVHDWLQVFAHRQHQSTSSPTHQSLHDALFQLSDCNVLDGCIVPSVGTGHMDLKTGYQGDLPNPAIPPDTLLRTLLGYVLICSSTHHLNDDLLCANHDHGICCDNSIVPINCPFLVVLTSPL